MKTAKDIKGDFPGTVTRTSGKGNVYECAVELHGETIKGLGTSLESCEYTAWYSAGYYFGGASFCRNIDQLKESMDCED